MNNHTGNTHITPCPIAQRRRKTTARNALRSVGMTGGFRSAQREVML